MEERYLKAKDLMLGNLILVDENFYVEDEYNPKCGVVDMEVYEVTIDGLDDDVLYDCKASGIPLERNHLEAIGFESYSREKTSIYGINLNGIHIVLTHMDYYWQVTVDSTIYRQIKIRYVHELQQFLNLVKLDLKIEKEMIKLRKKNRIVRWHKY